MTARSAAEAALRHPVGARAAAASRLLAQQRQFDAAGRNILDRMAARFDPDTHYPCDDVGDAESHAHFFFHRHGAGGEAGSGHFHTFLGKAGMPAGVHPQIFPEIVLAPLAASSSAAEAANSGPRFPGVFSHLVAVGIDAAGSPDRLFTTNRWVTGETWYAGPHVAAMLPHFRFDAGAGTSYAVIGAWLADLLHMLRPIVAQLLDERDRTLADWRRRRSRQIHVLDDRRLEIVSERRIDFAAELAAALAGSD